LQSTVQSYDEAACLYSTAQSERFERQLEVQIALADLQEAMLKVESAQNRLMEAEFNVGRARHIARASGFCDVFRKRRTTRTPTVQLGGMQIPFFTVKSFIH
jgi:hypothetical protein